MAITPIPSTRVSDLLIRQRLLSQLTSDQLNLVRIQTQISTGRRFVLPSEDAPAALRAIGLQQLLERKQQVQTNLQTNQSFLDATDTALSNSSNLLASARATGLSVSDSVSSGAQRTAAGQEIQRILQQLVDTGNQNFRGRYLFAGSQTTTRPFENKDGFVQFNGNDDNISSYADVDVLFETNADGDTVFGAFSSISKGTADLNPIVTANMPLAQLHAGQGVSQGSIEISDGSSISIVDLSGSKTIGDVAALIEAHPPTGRTIRATVTSTGLSISLDTAGGGNLTIREVAGGTTASELGIFHDSGIGPGPVVSSDLDPRLTLTTPLRNLLGVRATALVNTAGPNNDLQFEATTRGAGFNGVAISFVDNPAITAGSETVVYDAMAGTLIFQVDGGNTTAGNIVNALNNDPVAGLAFQASLTSADSSDTGIDGTGAIDITATTTTAGGSGIEFDQSSGLQISSGGTNYTINLTTARTVEDLLNLVNGADAGVLAEINEDGTGINIRSRLSGADFGIGENGGQTATQLGLRTFTAGTRLDELNHGLGVHENTGNDFTIQRKDGTVLSFDVSGAQTIGDILNLINNDPNNLVPATRVTAQLAAVGNGIELVTSDPSNVATFEVRKLNSSQAAQDLGLIPVGSTTSAAPVVNGGVETITGRDTNPAEVQGVFNSLLRLSQALNANDLIGIQRAIGLIDGNNLQLNLARAELGARQQGLDSLSLRVEDEVLSLRDSLSNEIDVDVASAISDLTARQAAYEATLKTTAITARLTLLDYL